MSVDLRVVSRQLGLLMFVLSTLILAAGIFAGVDRALGPSTSHTALIALLSAALVGSVLGGILYFAGRSAPEVFGHREALLLVALSWLVGAALAGLPYRFWSAMRADAHLVGHGLDSYINCYFEAMSGLTTTGATVLDAIGTVPRSLLLWRATTHWLGGLGIVVLFVAVLPMLGVGSRRVYRIEAPGPAPEGVHPRMRETARILWLIYLGLTVLEISALMLCGMNWFDATCHTFATLATGGFSTLDASIAGFGSSVIHLVIVLFMFLAGVNFYLYHQIIRRQWRNVLLDPELRAYVAILLIATVIVTISVWRSSPAAAPNSDEPSFALTARNGLFQVVSIQTTTGFCNTDFDQWSFSAKATLLTLMFIGASAGSTGGGIKVVRVLIAVKVVLAEFEHVYRPKVVRSIKVGRSTIDTEMKVNTLVYLVGIAVLFALGTTALMIFEAHQDIDITTAATATAATLNNIGPGLARVGATQNYAWFGNASKVVMSILMLLGRLEMFTVVVLFSPRFWRGE